MFPPRSTIHASNSPHARRARRLLTATAVLAVGALALSGCAGGSSGTTTLDKDAKVKLTFWTGQADASYRIDTDRPITLSAGYFYQGTDRSSTTRCSASWSPGRTVSSGRRIPLLPG